MDIDGINSFIDRETAEWPMAYNSFKSLQDVLVRDIIVNDCLVKIQHNPARAISSGAKTDAKSITVRPCFLCSHNRDAKQNALEWKSKNNSSHRYDILVNPFPIFERHLTIVDTEHVEQSVSGRLTDLFELSLVLQDFTVFYNGPRCGASAPDHMHFQAAPSIRFPLWQWAEKKMVKMVKSDGGYVRYYNSPFRFIIVDAKDEATFNRLFARTVSMETGNDIDIEEPMMNILARSVTGGVEAALLFRKAHRPDFFSTTPGQGMMISPASVDLGGVFILPRREDYDNINRDIIEDIYKQTIAMYKL